MGVLGCGLLRVVEAAGKADHIDGLGQGGLDLGGLGKLHRSQAALDERILLGDGLREVAFHRGVERTVTIGGERFVEIGHIDVDHRHGSEKRAAWGAVNGRSRESRISHPFGGWFAGDFSGNRAEAFVLEREGARLHLEALVGPGGFVLQQPRQLEEGAPAGGEVAGFPSL